MELRLDLYDYCDALLQIKFWHILWILCKILEYLIYWSDQSLYTQASGTGGSVGM